MELFIMGLIFVAIMYVCFKIGQVDVRMQAEECQKELFRYYDSDSNDEKSFRNGVRFVVGYLTHETQDYELTEHADTDEINAAEISTIYDLLVSFDYNRSNDDMIELCKELIDRLTDKDWYNKRKSTDDGDIIYGYIIMLFGDYGTSPRSGWFENKNKQLVPLIVDQIKQRLQELNIVKEMEES